ncbi:50S ribosomal protein L25/general stress protein Ctc [Comamonas serinivorans]|uniref:Large ribosomal subunit protein bL25 n=1 Tax=Comamonas serinivorans TaxID=1082851 RepID=A0A1Y0ERW8_9BURK|nr:50S ribosomal protein L25/general stress protein Ctc [Comamonas serinivorans]ARU06059.1 50S ribosomal protein L25/general stress protein Ctc [Comamonas serinivorans]
MKFVAFERSTQGTGASRRLRNAGKVPGVVYATADAPAQLIELDHNALWFALKKEAFHASLLDMELGGVSSKVLLRDVQYHPYRQQVLHIDFQRVAADQKITIKVPLHFEGEAESPAVKTDKCLITHQANEVEVVCLASALPEHITVDLSKLTKGQTLHFSDIVLPQGVELRAGLAENSLVLATPPKGGSDEAPAAEADKA